jgi:hypothetical protein
MSARHNCARCLVWPKHHGRQKSAIVRLSDEYCALPNSWRSSVVTNSMIVRKTLHDQLYTPLCNTRANRMPDTKKILRARVRIDTARITHIKKLHGQLLETHRAGSEQDRPVRFPLARWQIPSAVPSRRASLRTDGMFHNSVERTGLNQPVRFKQRLWQPSAVTP